jgi:CrcB protein
VDDVGVRTATPSSGTDRRRRLSRHGARVVGVISAGGVIGSVARYGVGAALPADPGGLPVATLLVNTSGCLLIGILTVLVVDVWAAHPLVRPFLGVGLLGGYTTFSAATVEVQELVTAGRPGLALGYLLGTTVAALAAVQLGMTLTRAIALRRPRHDGGT